jgi:O-antigen/teichoic acid export membrane protein
MPKKSRAESVRKVLFLGSMVFGLSALALLLTPNLFDSLLGLSSTDSLEWSMRMIGITLIALSGNMFSVASRGSEASVLLSGRVMLVSAFGLGVLTLLLPIALNWFSITYALVGFGFSAAYASALFRKSKR